MNLPIPANSRLREFEALLASGQMESAFNLLDEITLSDPGNRELQLYALLLKVDVFGPEPFELEIDRIRSLKSLTDVERCTVAAIFQRGYDAAFFAGARGKAWAYRHCLRQLNAGEPMDGRILPLVSENKPWFGNTPSFEIRATQSEDPARLPATDDPVIGITFSPSRAWMYYAVIFAVFGVLVWLLKFPESITVQADRAATNVAPASPVLDRASALANRNEDHIPVFLDSSVAPPPKQTAAPTAPPSVGQDAPRKTSVDQGAPRKTVQVKKERRPAKADMAQEEEQVKADPPPRAVVRSRVVTASQPIGLRDEPAYSAPKGVSLEPGTRLVTVERAGNWLKVRNEATGRTGYVREEFLTSAGLQQ